MRPVKADWSRKVPAITFWAQDFADSAVRQRLKSGLPQTLVTRVYSYREGDDNKPVAISILSCRVVYDLWGETFQVQLQKVDDTRVLFAESAEAVARLCLIPNNLMVGTKADYAKLRGKALYFAVIVEFNPMSDSTVERVRRWIARSGESGQLTSDAFFGSFVSIFVGRKMGSAERTLRFRSPAVWVP